MGACSLSEEILGVLERLRGLKEEKKILQEQQRELQLKENRLTQQLDSFLESWSGKR